MTIEQWEAFVDRLGREWGGPAAKSTSSPRAMPPILPAASRTRTTWGAGREPGRRHRHHGNERRDRRQRRPACDKRADPHRAPQRRPTSSRSPSAPPRRPHTGARLRRAGWRGPPGSQETARPSSTRSSCLSPGLVATSSRTGCSPRFSSPISSARRRRAVAVGDGSGATSWNSIARWCGASSPSFAAARSIPRATASTGELRRPGARRALRQRDRRRCSRPRPRGARRPAHRRVRADGRQALRPDHHRRASLRWRAPARFWSRHAVRISSPVRAELRRPGFLSSEGRARRVADLRAAAVTRVHSTSCSRRCGTRRGGRARRAGRRCRGRRWSRASRCRRSRSGCRASCSASRGSA